MAMHIRTFVMFYQVEVKFKRALHTGQIKTFRSDFGDYCVCGNNHNDSHSDGWF